MKKSEILIFTAYYLPGYKAGGPIKSISNMIDNLGDEFTFKIITRDRDLGDSIPYDDKLLNTWHKSEGIYIYYISPDKLNFLNLLFLLKNTTHDFLYLNSFFDPNFTFKVLLASKFFHKYSSKIILAPRGEFSSGALKLKSLKKKVYLSITKLSGLFRDVTFQASSSYEYSDIINNSPFKSNHIKIAIDLPSKIDYLPPEKLVRNDQGCLKVIFLSRISPMKNLKFALKILKNVSREIKFDIYGPIEDVEYWSDCLKIIQDLPNNVKLTYLGSVKADNVKSILLNYDLFFLPSKGENYGHVIAESLSVGTPVLISNNTPWKDLENDNLGWEFDLSEMSKFVSVIEKNTQKIDFLERINNQSKAIKKIINPKDIEDNKQLFINN